MKLTPQMIEDLVESFEFLESDLSPTLTICVLKLANGATVTGTSNVINPDNFDRSIGQKVSLENAKGKIWELEGYAMKTRG